MAKNDFPTVLALMKKYGTSVVAEMITRLRGSGKVASGKLLKSLAYDVQENVNGIELFFEMLPYGEFVDKGVNGTERNNGSKFTFRTGPSGGTRTQAGRSIRAWCKLKGIPLTAAWPIARNIGRFGIRPTNFFTLSTTRRAKQFEQDLAVAMSKDFELQIYKMIKDISKK